MGPGHPAAAGLVISIHIAAMYLPSPLSGWPADRVGRRPGVAAAGIVLLAAGLVAATAPARYVAALAIALALLGLGWNLGLVGGTALLTDALPLTGCARTQPHLWRQHHRDRHPFLPTRPHPRPAGRGGLTSATPEFDLPGAAAAALNFSC